METDSEYQLTEVDLNMDKISGKETSGKETSEGKEISEEEAGKCQELQWI